MSEDEAYRRAHASRIARKFPVLFGRVAAGEIHLTGLLMLGPHLTEENHLEVLARAKNRTKKEINRLVRMLDPLPSVPAVVEPLGPPIGIASPRNPTWTQMATALANCISPVRELEPGDRPNDWMDADADMTDVGGDMHGEPTAEVTGEAPSGEVPCGEHG